VVGIKPTVGLIPSSGIVPISAVQDAPGPLTRSVRLTAALLDVMVDRASGHYSASLREPSTGIRVGVVREYFGAHSASDGVVESAIQRLSAAGVVVVDPVPSVKLIDQLESDVDAALLFEFADGLTRYLAEANSGDQAASSPQSIADLVAFNEAHREAELSLFGQEYLVQAATLIAASPRPLESSDYLACRARLDQSVRTEGLDAIFGEHRLDALVSPAFPPAPLIDPVLGDYGDGGDCTTAPAVAGYPIISVPVGFVSGLPVGVAMSGPQGSEATLLRLVRTLEMSLGLLETGQLSAPL
jgi:amidase